MKSMGSGWENLKIQLALKGLTALQVYSFECYNHLYCLIFKTFSDRDEDISTLKRIAFSQKKKQVEKFKF